MILLYREDRRERSNRTSCSFRQFIQQKRREKEADAITARVRCSLKTFVISRRFNATRNDELERNPPPTILTLGSYSGATDPRLPRF